MCGRYSNNAEFSDLRVRFEASEAQLLHPFEPKFNIAPSLGPGFEQLIVVANDTGARELRQARWSFIPSFWTSPLNKLPSTFNARAEQVADKPFWRAAFAGARCLVPATGWREFTGERGKKQPHQFQLAEELFAFAGLWSTWHSPEGEVVDSFAILTTAPSPQAAAIHDRMPLVLDSVDYASWLERGHDPRPLVKRAAAASLTRPLEIYASNPIGNAVGFEGPQVIEAAPVVTPVRVQQEMFPAAASVQRPRRAKR